MIAYLIWLVDLNSPISIPLRRIVGIVIFSYRCKRVWQKHVITFHSIADSWIFKTRKSASFEFHESRPAKCWDEILCPLGGTMAGLSRNTRLVTDASVGGGSSLSSSSNPSIHLTWYRCHWFSIIRMTKRRRQELKIHKRVVPLLTDTACTQFWMMTRMMMMMLLPPCRWFIGTFCYSVNFICQQTMALFNRKQTALLRTKLYPVDFFFANCGHRRLGQWSRMQSPLVFEKNSRKCTCRAVTTVANFAIFVDFLCLSWKSLVNTIL